ncbi:hypothetical protein GW17_00039639, partial [Ensete ventricosum]
EVALDRRQSPLPLDGYSYWRTSCLQAVLSLPICGLPMGASLQAIIPTSGSPGRGRLPLQAALVMTPTRGLAMGGYPFNQPAHRWSSLAHRQIAYGHYLRCNECIE